ncbi:MAG: hypothetical protein K1V84_06165 [Muribaculaceae bacterium]
MIRKLFKKLNKTNSQFIEVYSLIKTLKFFIRKSQMEDFILHCPETGTSKTRYCDREIIVSLTSYGKRIYDVCYTIESLMQQTLKPNKIILWLSDELQNVSLPQSLKSQISRGLEIRYTKDIRSYKKLIPALHEFPNAVIITVDDDAIYEFDIIDRMVQSYLGNPTKIYATRVHRIRVDNHNNLLPYNEWEWNAPNNEDSKYLFFTGVGAVLYPPNALHPEVLNQNVFMNICPTADDIWFNAMARLNKTEIAKVLTRTINSHDYLENPNVQDIGLVNINVLSSQKNDIQLRAVFNKYNLFQLLGINK